MNLSHDEDDSFERSSEPFSEPEIPIDVKEEPDFTPELVQEIQYEFIEDSQIDDSQNETTVYEDSQVLESKGDECAQSSGNSQSDDESDLDSSRKNKNSVTREDYDPDYEPHDSRPIPSEDLQKTNGSMNLKNYKRTLSRSGCIFKDCDLKETALIPDIVRIKLLQEYKLYIQKYSKACSIHTRDQNWEELVQWTYNDFTAPAIEDILRLLKEASQASFNFETMELIPTRFIRYWMNVNKLQFQRVFDGFPLLKTLDSPKTALAVYLMYLQNNDIERIALLLQVPETMIMERVHSVQAIVPCKNYDELNKMFQLEY